MAPGLRHHRRRAIVEAGVAIPEAILDTEAILQAILDTRIGAARIPAPGPWTDQHPGSVRRLAVQDH